MLLRASFRDGDKVGTRTLAHLTSWAPERIEALRRALNGEVDGLTGDLPPVCGPLVAVLLVRTPLAERVGVRRVLGPERGATRVMWLLLARVAAHGSRLSAGRWAAPHAVAETLGRKPCDADALDEARERLAEAPEDMADALDRRTVRQRAGTPTVVVSAVTASDLAGAQHALAACGSNRDQKPGQAPIVSGLLTTAAGEPWAVHVDEGHTADPVTVPAPVQTLRPRLGMTETVCVGERGRSKTTGQAALTAAGGRSITALTTPQGRRLLQAPVLRVAWCTAHVPAVAHGAVRLIRRRSAALRQHAVRRRADTLAQLQRLITTRHPFVPTSTRAKPEAGLQTRRAWVQRHPLDTCVQVSRHAGPLMATRDAMAHAAATPLEGCDVRETDVSPTALDAHTVHDRYRDLQAVAQDFRTLQTGLVEVRPIGVRHASRPRAQVWVTMVAWNVVRAMRRALVAVFGTTEDDQLAVTVEEALVAFARLCRLTYHLQGTAVGRWPTPDARQAAILHAWGTPVPTETSRRHM